MATAPISRVLAAVDLSSCSRAALEFACRLAAPFGASLDVLLVAKADEAEAMKKELHGFVATVGATHGLTVTERVAVGDAREQILAHAESGKADAIVLGTHGRTGRARSLAGSVAESVVRTAACPVITVRER
jgi:nucleotide-binding universal stress UspA family protein